MFKVNKHPILADEMEVLNELKSQLAINGIDLFREFKPGTRNIQFNCPVHGDGQERKPSCGVTTEDKKRDGGETIPAGTVHCFTCGYTASLEEMISYCFGHDDFGEFGKSWLIKNFLTVSIDDRKEIILDMGRGRQRKEKITYVPDSELYKYRYYHDYMFERKLTEEVIELYDVGYDPKYKLYDKFGNVSGVMKCITFPIRDETGGTLYLARRSVTTKFFHYPDGVLKPVYGLYELPDDVDEVIVCESIINALTCRVYGKWGVALNGTGTEYQYEQLRKLNVRKLITALDPDKAGRAATKRLKEGVGTSKLITTYDLPPDKDINDLTLEEFKNLEELF